MVGTDFDCTTIHENTLFVSHAHSSEVSNNMSRERKRYVFMLEFMVSVLMLTNHPLCSAEEALT